VSTKEPFSSLTFRSDSPKDILQNHKFELSYKMVEAVLYCIDNKEEGLIFADIIVPFSQEVVHLSVYKDSFIDILDKNLKILEDHEEYEMCAEVLKAKNKLIKKSSRTPIKKNKKEAISNLIHAIKKL
jgi:hypothetical protein